MSNRSTVSQKPLAFLCNRCLSHLKLFEAAQTTGGRVPKHYWTSCHHVLCQNCRMRHTDKCAACNQACRFMEINNNMPKHYKVYFESAHNMQNILNGVVKFQRRQDDLSIARKVQHIERKLSDEKQAYNEARMKGRRSVAQEKKVDIIFRKCQEKKRRMHEQMRIAEERKRERERQRRMVNSQVVQPNRRDRGNGWSQFHGQAQHLHGNQPTYETPGFRTSSDFGDAMHPPAGGTPQVINPFF